MRYLLLAATLASCVQSNLVPCGSLLCPVGSVCIDDNYCADKDQLSACTNMPEGMPCVTTIGNGTCRDGVCMVDHCGDGHVDPGEVCDDGNLISGDGCRADCRSDESCGNGLFDVGENCDCGSTPDTLAPGCVTVNSDDPTAQCDLDCSRECGDSQVTGSEQCDGTDVPVTCAQLGYYAGMPSCTSYCALDPSTCSGRCGDGIVQSSHGEDCDQTDPSGSCVEFGRDFGVLQCGSFCVPDIAASCDYFGWHAFFANTTTLTSAASNARGALGLDAGTDTVYVSWDGVITQRTMDGWTATASTSTTLFAAGPTSLGTFDGTWHVTTIAIGSSAEIAATNTTVYVIHSDCSAAAITLATSTLDALPSAPATACSSPIVAGSDLYVAGGAAGLLRWNGAAWSNPLAGPVLHVDRGAPGHLVVEQSVTESDDIDLAASTLTGVTLPYPYNDYTAGIDTDGDVVERPVSGAVFVYRGGLGGTAGTPAPVTTLRQGADGTVLAYGSGAYRYDPMPVARTPPLSTGFVYQLLPLADGGLAYCGDEIAWLDAVGNPTSRTPPKTCRRLVGDPRGAHMFASTGNGIYEWDSGSSTYTNTLAVTGYTALAGDLTEPFAINNAQLSHRVSGTWTPITLPGSCTATDVAGLGAAALYVLVDCGATQSVLKWNGAGLDTIATTSTLALYNGVVTADGGLFITAADSTYISVWKLVGSSIDLVAQDARIEAAVAADDIYVSQTTSTAYHLLHITGGHTSEINVSSLRLAATPNAIVIWTLSDGLSFVARMPSRFGTAGL